MPANGRAPQEQGRSDDLLFSGADGGVLSHNSFRLRSFEPALAAIRGPDPDFPTLTPHDLRHTAASLAVSAGANVKAVQRMVGRPRLRCDA